MRIGIVTQPLCANYGGILQNLALQRTLKMMGHEPITLDLSTHLNTSKKGYLRYCASTIVKSLLKGRKIKILSYNQERRGVFDEFVSQNIITTDRIKSYVPEIIKKYNLDCIIVGSDQVWRPRYNVYPEDMFLSFASGVNLRKVAYAASFGTDEWEYTPNLTDKCRKLVTAFNAVSVREESGVKLCEDHLNITPVLVLDPTLLHTKEYYNAISNSVNRSVERYIAVYTLNIPEYVKDSINEFAKRNEMKVRLFTSDSGHTLTVEEWISVFRDATFVITDSFHGTAFSIIYEKPFVTLANSSRGMARFHSLLNQFNLADRLMRLEQPNYELLKKNIDWKDVERKKECLVNTSKSFLEQNLSK